jgi:anti-sigma factor RsiW
MKTDDIQLMAYVDGNLPPQDRQKIEAEIRGSVKTAARIALLQASRLPYRQAFAHQKLPPVPQGLIKRIADMVLAALEPRANAFACGATTPSQDTAQTQPCCSSRIRRSSITLKW